LTFYTFSYLGLFASLLVAVVVGVTRRSLDRARLAVGGATAALALLPVALAPKIAPSSTLNLANVSKRDLNGAPVHDYFIPSDHHTLYGILVHRLFGTHEGENVIFFGYTVIILGILGAVRAVRDWRAVPPALRVAAVLIPAGFLASLPAYLPFGHLSVPFPDAAMLIGSFAQWWRIYTRFAVLVGFGLAILAAYSLDRMLGRGRHLSVMLLVALILLEAFPGAPFAVTRLRPDRADVWLAAHPGGIVAIYPMLTPDEPHRGSVADFDNYVWGSLYEQVNYHHPLFALPSLDADTQRSTIIRSLAANLGDPRTPSLLAAEHVRYVVVRRDVARELGIPVRLPRTGLARVARLGQSDVLRVTAKAANLSTMLARRAGEVARIYAFGSPAASFRNGFYAEEVYNGFHARWLSQDGVVSVQPGRPTNALIYRMTLTGFSNRIPHRLTITEDGHDVASVLIPTFQTAVAADMRLPDSPTILRFHADPGPTKLGATDDRVTSVYIESLRFNPVRLIPQ
jgi:hypothetical protein